MKEVPEVYTQHFRLNEKEQRQFNEWKEAIKKVFGSYGSFTYSFTPGEIGCEVTVFSEIANKTLDLTDVESW